MTSALLYDYAFDKLALLAFVGAYLVIWLAGLDPKEVHRPVTCRTNRTMHLLAILRVGTPASPPRTVLRHSSAGATETNNSSCTLK